MKFSTVRSLFFVVFFASVLFFAVNVFGSFPFDFFDKCDADETVLGFSPTVSDLRVSGVPYKIGVFDGGKFLAVQDNSCEVVEDVDVLFEIVRHKRLVDAAKSNLLSNSLKAFKACHNIAVVAGPVCEITEVIEGVVDFVSNPFIDAGEEYVPTAAAALVSPSKREATKDFVKKNFKSVKKFAKNWKKGGIGIIFLSVGACGITNSWVGKNYEYSNEALVLFEKELKGSHKPANYDSLVALVNELVSVNTEIKENVGENELRFIYEGGLSTLDDLFDSQTCDGIYGERLQELTDFKTFLNQNESSSRAIADESIAWLNGKKSKAESNLNELDKYNYNILLDRIKYGFWGFIKKKDSTELISKIESFNELKNESTKNFKKHNYPLVIEKSEKAVKLNTEIQNLKESF